jgi:Glucose-6-phosphate dehydrogenase, NAD binding domain
MATHHSDALVFFGATGDLAYKKIFPALQAMVPERSFPPLPAGKCLAVTSNRDCLEICKPPTLIPGSELTAISFASASILR